MAFSFPSDANGNVGAVKPIRGGEDFLVPVLDVVGTFDWVSSTVLAANATFTGPTNDRLASVGNGMFENRVRIYSESNAASASAGLIVEESNDGTTWATIGTGTTASAGVLADSGWRSISRRYWRVRYVNGATAQSRFALIETRDVVPDDVLVNNAVNVNSGVGTRTFEPFYTDSTTALAASATFTGTARDCQITTNFNGYSTVRVRAFADQAGTIFIDQSRDNATWRSATGHNWAVAAGETVQAEVPIVTRFVRVRYVNGATAQGAFELISELATVGPK